MRTFATNDNLIPIKHTRCPRCKCEPMQLQEMYINHGISFIVEDGKRHQAGSFFMGIPARVNGVCRCGHIWTLRGVRQITEIDELIP